MPRCMPCCATHLSWAHGSSAGAVRPLGGAPRRPGPHFRGPLPHRARGLGEGSAAEGEHTHVPTRAPAIRPPAARTHSPCCSAEGARRRLRQAWLLGGGDRRGRQGLPLHIAPQRAFLRRIPASCGECRYRSSSASSRGACHLTRTTLCVASLQRACDGWRLQACCKPPRWCSCRASRRATSTAPPARVEPAIAHAHSPSLLSRRLTVRIQLQAPPPSSSRSSARHVT